MNKFLFLFLIVLAMVVICLGQTGSPAVPSKGNQAYSVEDSIRGAKSLVPKDGFIPDATTAKRVAEAILIPIYGEQDIAAQRPFEASLKGNIWLVAGTLPSHLVGGTAIVKLSKKDGRVIF